jgi:hypothetical protein
LSSSFQPLTATPAQGQRRRPDPILRVIKADAVDFDFDVGQGGVRLAQETAVQISGKVQHSPGTATAALEDLDRYDRLRAVSESAVTAALEAVGAKIVCTGLGKETFKDPGSGIVKDVTYAPKDAARDALVGAGTCMDCERIQINFLGGDDLQVMVVLDAVQQLVLNLDVKTKCKISYQSIADSSVPLGAATVTVVGWTDASITEGSSVLADLSDLERSVALGNLYYRDGAYYTVLEEDLNSATA